MKIVFLCGWHGHAIQLFTPDNIKMPQVGPEEKGIGKRQWRDGTLESDLPMMQLKELFNVNHFIVSQANPHIAPLLRLKEIVRAYGGDFAGKVGKSSIPNCEFFLQSKRSFKLRGANSSSSKSKRDLWRQFCFVRIW